MFRNRELLWPSVLFFIMAFITAVLGFCIDRKAGILVVGSSAVFGTLFFAVTRSRYQSIARISEEIDQVLHKEEHLFIGGEKEGELSVLQSEIMKMTLRLREQNEALKREKKHLADSLADIAHQLRTPLTSVNLILSLLENSKEEEERRGMIREITELLVQMDFLLTSLLQLSRLDAGIVDFQRETIKVCDLIRKAVHPFLIQMELHNIVMQMDIPDKALIYGDFAWLSEAVQNLVKNCMESAGDNGKLWITCTDTLLFTEISVHDNGPGFQKEDIPCLFDRFYRGSSKSAVGYGIGLSLCRLIVVRQGGTVTAKNHPQGGAVFCIRFPK